MKKNNNDAEMIENKDGTYEVIFGRRNKDGSFQPSRTKKSMTVGNKSLALAKRGMWMLHGQE